MCNKALQSRLICIRKLLDVQVHQTCTHMHSQHNFLHPPFAYGLHQCAPTLREALLISCLYVLQAQIHCVRSFERFYSLRLTAATIVLISTLFSKNKEIQSHRSIASCFCTRLTFFWAFSSHSSNMLIVLACLPTTNPKYAVHFLWL